MGYTGGWSGTTEVQKPRATQEAPSDGLTCDGKKVMTAKKGVYAMVQIVPPPPLLSESRGVEVSESCEGSERMAGMEKNEVKESIDMLERWV